MRTQPHDETQRSPKSNCLQPNGYQATSILSKMAAEEPLKIVLRFSFGERFSHFERLHMLVQRSGLIMERNVNDQGLISYLNDQEYGLGLKPV